MDQKIYRQLPREGRHRTRDAVSPPRKREHAPRINRRLQEIFEGIGIPEPGPFRPDPFQLEALRRLKSADVLVSAPTGSGKTWIATEAIKDCLAQGKRAWYASPLKALSNSKFLEFTAEFGEERVGILTGDRKENADASVIVGTTEIIRNHLYDAMSEGTQVETDLVILDEAHYLGDQDRGVVWEEVLIYLPSRVNLLLLSATIQNSGEIARWLQEVRGKPCEVVTSEERPVPLYPLFMFPDDEIVPLSGSSGLSHQISAFVERSSHRKSLRMRSGIRFGQIIKVLRYWNLLPAIFFLKSRSDCDNALLTCLISSDERDREREKAFHESLEKSCSAFPFLRNHKQLSFLMNSRVGAHHGGQLPHWKLLVEKMMNGGHLEAIFSTSTVAAGVNFPARTVVLVQSDRFNGKEFADLTATELHQMTGRAGRRGKDKIGFALVLPGPFQDPHLIDSLLSSSPEPIVSQIKMNFSMVLNLLLAHRPEDVRGLLDKSFATYQNRTSHQEMEKEWEQLTFNLKRLLPERQCEEGNTKAIFSFIIRRREILEEISAIERGVKRTLHEESFLEHLQPGRLFVHKRGGIYCLFELNRIKEGLELISLRVDRRVKVRYGKLGLKRIHFNQVKALLDVRVEIPLEWDPDVLNRLFSSIPFGSLPPISIEAPRVDEDSPVLQEEKILLLKESLQALPCEQCTHLRSCHGYGKNPLKRLIRKIRVLTAEIDRVRHRIWYDFLKHLDFLKEAGFVDSSDYLTEDGVWASRLRLDQPLLIGEAIRRKVFDAVTPELLVSLIAPFVIDKYQEVDLNTEVEFDREAVREGFNGMINSLRSIRNLEKERGFEGLPLQFWPVVTLYAWACGKTWEELIKLTGVDEGNLSMLILRTADNLRQIALLRDTHPALADKARQGISLILREPVLMP
jgi:superfamily II RNA helicase